MQHLKKIAHGPNEICYNLIGDAPFLVLAIASSLSRFSEIFRKFQGVPDKIMAESLSNLLGTMLQQNGVELRLEPGVPVILVNASGTHNLTSAPLTTAEIGALVLPLIDEKVRKTLTALPQAEFTYKNGNAGEFNVIARKSPKGLMVTFKSQPHTDASAPTTNNSGPLSAPGHSGPLPDLAAAQVIQHPSAPLPPAQQHAGPAQPHAKVVVPPRSVKMDTSKMDSLLRAMAKAGGSDLHLSVSMPPLMRKDGQIMPLGTSPEGLTAELARPLLLSIMPQANREEFDRRHDTDFAYEIAGLARFRCNVFMDRKGMGGVFRVIPNEILTSEKLGLSHAILNLCKLNKGLVVVTGPTGSGKSTTLCAMVDFINRTRQDHLITIEDPIEFVHENKMCLVNQREVHNHTDSFKDALRAALREDPDIVLVGEMRDLETISIAIETAETGHLVFGTLHTTTAASTVDRIIDQFPTDRQAQIRVMLSESLRGVIAQTLLRKKGGGRIAALEVLIVTPAISNLIREGKTFQIASSMQTGRNIGMVTLNDALADLVKRDIVEAEEAYIKAVDKTGFELALKRLNINLPPGITGATPALKEVAS
jgi:twitching motility protein PilT